MKKSQRKRALLLCTVLSVSALWGCAQKVSEETADDVAVIETAKPEIGELKLTGNFIATVSPDESVYVIPKTTAEVLEVKVKAGDVVEEGQVLAVLDDTIARINYDNAQIAMRTAQIQLDNAQHSYNMQYGNGATTLNDMQSDSNISKAEDGVNQLQENMADAMDNLQKAKNKLADKEKELADLKEEYDFREDVDEIKDYANTFDKNTLEGAQDYQAAMLRYQEAAAAVAPVEGAITQYKSTIDQLEETIETLQDNIDSTYESYSQVVTSTNIQNGEIREEQKQTGQNAISASQVGVEQAQNTVKQAQENLDMYSITATISGVVETVNVKVHDFAASSNPAFVISNKDAMVATYYVSEDVRNTFSAGQKVELEKDGNIYDGEVIEIGSAVDTQTGLFKIKAAVRGNAAGLLSGTKATVTTDTYHEKNAVIVPYNSVYYDGTQAYVYTVVDGKAKKTNVTTGLYDIDNIVITEGLTSEDTVITTWSAQLRDGVEVSVKNKEVINEDINNADKDNEQK